jgi:steroid delta-isomerase
MGVLVHLHQARVWTVGGPAGQHAASPGVDHIHLANRPAPPIQNGCPAGTLTARVGIRRLAGSAVNPQQLAVDHVRRFNASVAAADFSPLVESLSEDATMAFEGMPVGPFAGKAAIAEAYRQSPPDDIIDLLEVRQTDPAGAEVEYVWHSDPAKRGRLRLGWTPDGLLQTMEIRVG